MGGCCAMDNPIGNFFRDIFCSDSVCGYNPGPSKTAAHAKKIAEELAQMKEHYNDSASNAEKKIMEDITSSMNYFLDELAKINKDTYGGKPLAIDIKAIKEKNNQLSKNVVGHVGSVIESRLVQTDPELSIILKEDDDKKRKKSFDKFCEDIFYEAVLSLKKPITDSIRAQEKVIEYEIDQRLKEVTSSAERTMEMLSTIQEQKEQGDMECESAKLSCMYRLGLMDCILDELEN